MNIGADHNIKLIRSLQQSWSDPDPESFVALFTPDGVFQDMCYGLRIEGHDALRAHAQRMKKHNLDLRVDVTTCDATNLTGVAEWRLSHIYAGNFDGVDCSGIPVAICGLSIYHFAAGRIARAADYWNYFELIRALKVVPRELRQFPAG